MTKNADELLAISIAMRVQQYKVGCIARWSTSRAFLEASGCRHRASACAVLPWQPPWLTILAANKKNTTKTQLSASKPTVVLSKKAEHFWDPKQTLYSSHWCGKLHTNMKHHDSSYRAQLHFEPSNVVNGQKFKKLFSLNEAQKNLWARYVPNAVKLLKGPRCLINKATYPCNNIPSPQSHIAVWVIKEVAFWGLHQSSFSMVFKPVSVS